MTATTDFQDDFIPYKSGGTFFKICLICSSNPIMLGHDSGFRDSGLDPYKVGFRPHRCELQGKSCGGTPLASSLVWNSDRFDKYCTRLETSCEKQGSLPILLALLLARDLKNPQWTMIALPQTQRPKRSGLEPQRFPPWWIPPIRRGGSKRGLSTFSSAPSSL